MIGSSPHGPRQGCAASADAVRWGLPHDPALRGLMAIRTTGLAAAIPGLDLRDGDPIEIQVMAYKPGSRIALKVKVGSRWIAVKAYAKEADDEADLYEALSVLPAAASGVRAPPLLAWNRELRMLANGWLEGPTAHALLKSGQGARAGRLAAQWVRCAATLPAEIGRPLGPAILLVRAERCVAPLGAADRDLGLAAAAVTGILARTQPGTGAPRLVHGSLHDRNLIDLGDGPGVIDWTRFGQGPAEIDAGTFLASAWRAGLRESVTVEARLAEETFLAATGHLLEEGALSWYRSAALVCLADRVLTHRKDSWLERGRLLLGEASRHAQRTGSRHATVPPWPRSSDG